MYPKVAGNYKIQPQVSSLLRHPSLISTQCHLNSSCIDCHRRRRHRHRRRRRRRHRRRRRCFLKASQKNFKPTLFEFCQSYNITFLSKVPCWTRLLKAKPLV